MLPRPPRQATFSIRRRFGALEEEQRALEEESLINADHEMEAGRYAEGEQLEWLAELSDVEAARDVEALDAGEVPILVRYS